jgi:hypothetical protein
MILPNFLASRMAFCTWRPKTSLLLLVAHWKDVTNLGLEKSQPYKCSKKKDTPRIPLETPHLLFRFCGLFKFFFQEQGKAWARTTVIRVPVGS